MPVTSNVTRTGDVASADGAMELSRSAISWAAVLAGAVAACATTLMLLALGAWAWASRPSPRGPTPASRPPPSPSRRRSGSSSSSGSPRSSAAISPAACAPSGWMSTPMRSSSATRPTASWPGRDDPDELLDRHVGCQGWPPAPRRLSAVSPRARRKAHPRRRDRRHRAPPPRSTPARTSWTRCFARTSPTPPATSRKPRPRPDASCSTSARERRAWTPADRTYLAQTGRRPHRGSPQQDAEKRIDDVTAKAKAAAPTRPSQTADQRPGPRRPRLSFYTFFSMLIGAFIASASAALGGALRDE